MNWGVDHGLGVDPLLLWLWCRPAAVALIQSLAWDLPYAIGAALKRKRKKKKERKKSKKKRHRCSSDLALLWLWRRPAAVTPIGPLA